MTGLNLHSIAGNALDFINPWKDMVFTTKTVSWATNSRKPTVVEQSITVQGKLQPASPQTLQQLGFNLQEYQYWRVYLNLDSTQLDMIRQLGSDTFTCEGIKYRIVAKEDWWQDGWREAYCYVDDVIEEPTPTPTPPDNNEGGSNDGE